MTDRVDDIKYWEDEITKVEQRCDLSGLIKYEMKNKVVLNQYDHVKQPEAQTLVINEKLYKSLKRICRENAVILSSTLQFVWHKILSVYGNSNQTITGTIVSGRNLPIIGIETSVGLFINTLPLIVNHDAHTFTTDAIKAIQNKMTEMMNHSNVDFSQLSKGKMKHTLFDSLLAYENYPTLAAGAAQTEKLLKFEKSTPLKN